MAESENVTRHNLIDSSSDNEQSTLVLDKNKSTSSAENELNIPSLENQFKDLDISHRNDDCVKFIDFPFITETVTSDWIRSNQVMFILRGLPGSGKSTIVKKLRELYGGNDTRNFVVCSADHYFMGDDGSYEFEETKLKKAHLYCQSASKNSVINRVSTIVIDNTNIMKWEIQPYFQMANQGGYVVILVEPKTPWRFNAHILSEKNCHNVPKDVLLKKVRAYSPVTPMYYGWFLGKNETRKLRYGGKKLLKLCVEKCERFRSDFKELSSSMSNPKYIDYSSQYNFEYSTKSKPGIKHENSLLHCTSKYIGNSRKGKCKDGSRNIGLINDDSLMLNCTSRVDVEDAVGTISKLRVTGFIVSERTFGAKVELNNEQLRLFDQPSSSKGSKAHITLAITEGTSPVQAGIDTLEVFEQEKKNKSQKSGDFYAYKIPNTNYVLKRYRKGLWIVHTSTKELTFDAIFTGYYT